MNTKLIIVRHQSQLRTIDESEVLNVLTSDEKGLTRRDFLIDTGQFAIEGGVWDESEAYILQKARELRQLVDEFGPARILYFGLAEVPHVLAFGAYLSDQYRVEPFDYQRDHGNWSWPDEEATVEVEAQNLPRELMPVSGAAVIRVEISYPISDDTVEEVVGHEHLANIQIQLRGERSPRVASTVRSSADVQHIREVFRGALAELLKNRPGINLIHLFISAPVSVCLAIGQELHLRNNVPVQTYRYRKITGEPTHKEAILLTAEEAEAAGHRFNPEQVERAEYIRSTLWPQALAAVQQYAEVLQEKAKEGSVHWYEHLSVSSELKEAAPFPQLPPIWEVVQFKDKVDPAPRPGNEYGHTNDNNLWQLSDPLLIGLSEACGNNDEEVVQLIRLFLFHEYLHTHHSLTKYNTEGVGRFANCLERLDYMADLYAMLHQLDFMLFYHRKTVKDTEREFLVDQLDLLIRSTWAFIPGRVVNRFQARSVRRLLNWYWRHVQVQQAPDLRVALRVLAQPPAIELIGPMMSVGQGRIYLSMTQLDKTVELSIGLVLENAKFLRHSDGVVTNLRKLMGAFRSRNHQDIKIFFQVLFELAKQMNGALPTP